MKKDDGLLKNIRYCTRCCMPETVEGIQFDEMGICTVCQSVEQKMHIDWAYRERELARILGQAKTMPGAITIASCRSAVERTVFTRHMC